MPEKEALPSDAFMDRGEPLPRSYGRNRIWAVACDPKHLFAYWDLVDAPPARRVLRVRCLVDQTSQEIDLVAEADNWYIPVEPNRRYTVEIGLRAEDGTFCLLAQSDEAGVPVGDASQVIAEADLAGESLVVSAAPRAIDESAATDAQEPAVPAAEAEAGAAPEPRPSPLWQPTAELARLFQRAQASSSSSSPRSGGAAP